MPASKNYRLLRNGAWLAWAGAVNIANSVLLWAVLARWRTPAEVGRFAVAMSLYALFITLVPLGLTHYLSHAITQRTGNARREFIASAAWLLTLWGVVCAGLMAAAGWWAGVGAESRILALALLPTGLISVAEAVWNAQGRARVTALATTAENLLRTLVPLWLLAQGYDLTAVCWSFVAVRGVAAGVHAWAARSPWTQLLRGRAGLLTELARTAPAFAGVSLLAACYWQTGAVLASRWHSVEAAGHFGAASRFFIPLTVLLAGYAAVIQPETARLATQGRADVARFVARNVRLCLALLLPVACGAVLLAGEFMTLVFGPGYAAARLSLILLALGVAPLGLVMIVARGLTALGAQRVDLLANSAALAVNVALNAVLIPRYGANGAAVALCAALWAMALVMGVYWRRRVGRLEIGRTLQAALLPLAGLAAAVTVARPAGFFVAASAGAIVYLALSWLTQPELRELFTRRQATTTARPRVLMVGTHLTKTLGGITALAREILRSPLAQEFEFRYLASQADEYGKVGKLLFGLAAYARFLALLAWWRPALVYVHVGGNASMYRKTPFLLLARFFGCRTVAHFHAGDFHAYFPHQPVIGQRFIRAGLRSAGHLLACSGELREVLRALCPGAPVAVVPNGVETAQFTPRRADKKRKKETVTLLFVGAMGRLKGERDLLRAVARARVDAPHLRLAMLGHGAETVAGLCSALHLAPILQHLGPVAFTGRVEFFRDADFFVLPTYAEGMPLAVIEALAAGLPAVTTPVGAIPDLLQDGAEGYLVAPGDVDALAERITRLANDAGLRAQMSARALTTARRYDWSVVLQQLGNELKPMMNAK